MRMTEASCEMYNGVHIPILGFGTWKLKGQGCYTAVRSALKNGYRHFDTAFVYQNEKEVGRAIADSGVKRDHVFVTSKLPGYIKNKEDTKAFLEKTLTNLNMDFVDLYLIHSPWPWDQRDKDYSSENVDVWKVMEHLYKQGKCKSIGISNFEIDDIKPILEHCTIKPMVNQIQYYIGHTQEELSAYCREQQMLIEAYTPLASGKIFNSQEIANMASKYRVGISQIALRYILQKGAIPLVKSVEPIYMRENADLDFSISAEDMEALDHIHEKVLDPV